MKDLMLRIQARLQELSTVKDSNVCLIPDPDVVPGMKTYPYIGIKDGQVKRFQKAGGVTELALPVELYLYEKLIQEDKAILAIFDLTAAVHGKLKEHYFEGYVEEVEPGQESPVQLLYRKNGLILRKKLNYEYTREEE